MANPRHPTRLALYSESGSFYPRELTELDGKLYLIDDDGSATQLVKEVTIKDKNGNVLGKVSPITGADFTMPEGSTLIGASGATAGSYGPTSDTTPGYAGKINIPQVTINAKGLVTGITNRVLTLPSAIEAGTATPVVSGTAAVGTSTKYAREDHVHPAQTTVSGNAGTATRLQTARTIDGMSFNGSAAISHYGTCNTAAATAEKAVTLSGFSLVTGARIAVKFTVTNTAASPTLNVNSTGAKAIYYRGSAISAGYLAANRTYEFVYNGTQYELVGDIDTNTTYAAATKAPKAPGTAAVGTSTKYAREDHVHPAQTITHPTVTMGTDTTSATTPNYGGSFTAIDSITKDANGHVTKVNTKTITLKKPSTTYTATVDTTWSGSAAPYSKSITVTGITASDTPIIDVVLSATYATAQTQLENFSKIFRAVTSANTITLYANAKTTASISLQIKNI